jgi:hypothetical protein
MHCACRHSSHSTARNRHSEHFEQVHSWLEAPVQCSSVMASVEYRKQATKDVLPSDEMEPKPIMAATSALPLQVDADARATKTLYETWTCTSYAVPPHRYMHAHWQCMICTAWLNIRCCYLNTVLSEYGMPSVARFLQDIDFILIVAYSRPVALRLLRWLVLP